jgi:hypothetical protein
VEGRRPVFVARRREQAKRDSLRTVELLTRERASGNPVATAAYLIGGFTGNPISWIAREALRLDARKHLAATSDFYADRPSNEIDFPFTGTIHARLFDRASANYHTRFFADKITRDGTRIVMLENPALHQGGGQREGCILNLKAPLLEGKYPASWSIDTAVGVTSAFEESSVLLCAAARRGGGDVTLYDLPCLLPGPSLRAELVLYHSTTSAAADTLTVIWCVRYVDRTSELFHQQFGTGLRGAVSAPAAAAAVVTAAPSIFVNHAGERCLLVEVRVEGSKQIFRVDAFVHSQARNQVVGWGAASCPG